MAGQFGGLPQVVDWQRYDNHASDHAAGISPGEAEIVPMANCPITGRACVCDYDERNPSLVASNWGGVWPLAW